MYRQTDRQTNNNTVIQSQPNQYRYIWIDCAKGILIVLVILGHMVPIPVISNYVNSFHVPAFFIISGYLLKCKNNASFSKKQMPKYIIPYISFSLISIFIRFAYDFLFANEQLTDNLISYLIKFISLTGLPAIWFISSYFLARSIFSFTSRTKIWTQIIINFCVVLSVIVIKRTTGLLEPESNNYPALLFFNIFKGAFCSTFLFLGYMLKDLFDAVCAKCGKTGELGLSVCFLTICFVLSRINGNVNTSMLNFGKYPVLNLVCNIIGSYGVFFLCKSLFEDKNFKPLEYYGKNSMIVMATHINFLCIDIAFLIFRTVTGFIPAQWIQSDIIKYSVCLLLVMMLEIPIINIINRFFPIILGKKKSKLDK